MPGFVRKYASRSGGTVVQVIWKDGRRVADCRHIGTAHTDEDLELLLVLARQVIHEEQLEFDLCAAKDARHPRLVLERCYSQLLWQTLEEVYARLGFDRVGDETFRQLVLARVIKPVSKLDTIRVLEELGARPPSYAELCRTLSRCGAGDYRGAVAEACFARARPEALTLVLYDVTTLYFETDKEDDYRRPGLSKERRLDPQITVGLLVDRTGFPLEIASFEGNRAEVKTIIPVLANFRERHGLDRITAVADAAMLSAANIAELERLGFSYVIASRIRKTPYGITEHLAEPGAELGDGQVFESRWPLKLNGSRTERRVIYQYRAKRAALDLRNIEKRVAKAERMAAGEVPWRRSPFLICDGGEPKLNKKLIAEARRKAGIKGYVTDLEDVPAKEIIAAYHQLFEVERSFRMSKSDLAARPVYHRKREAIEAHLTVVFAALAVARHIQARGGVTLRRFVQTLEPLRSGVLLVGGQRRIVPPQIPPEAQVLLDALGEKGCGS